MQIHLYHLSGSLQTAEDRNGSHETFARNILIGKTPQGLTCIVKSTPSCLHNEILYIQIKMFMRMRKKQIDREVDINVGLPWIKILPF